MRSPNHDQDRSGSLGSDKGAARRLAPAREGSAFRDGDSTVAATYASSRAPSERSHELDGASVTGEVVRRHGCIASAVGLLR